MYIGYIGKKNRKEKEITQFNQSVTGFFPEWSAAAHLINVVTMNNERSQIH
jgi:hypothetical protein